MDSARRIHWTFTGASTIADRLAKAASYEELSARAVRVQALGPNTDERVHTHKKKKKKTKTKTHRQLLSRSEKGKVGRMAVRRWWNWSIDERKAMGLQARDKVPVSSHTVVGPGRGPP